MLLKKQFEHVGGLQNTLMQRKSPLQVQDVHQTILQVIHVRNSHWVALQVTGNTVSLYDSAYNTISKDAFEVIAKLVWCKDTAIAINVMNVAKQAGSSDCALFALANVTCLALGIDPLAVVFDQQQLRSHFVSTLETGHATAFPVVKKRRPATKVNRVETCLVYCYCRLPDDGDTMICCDMCHMQEWFHYNCLKTKPLDTSTWLCDNCVK